MANSYTAIPNIVPGNLVVNGKLTVNGGQFAMGKFQRQYRIQEIANGQFVETVNVDRIGATQDDVTTASLVRLIYATGPPFALLTEAAGAPMTDTTLLYQVPTEFQVWTNSVRIGSSIPFTRVVKTGNIAAVTANVMSDLLTRDTSPTSGHILQLDAGAQVFMYRVINALGRNYGTSPALCVWSDSSVHTTTGVTGSTTVASKTLPGNAMGPNSALMVSICGKATVGGTGSISLYLNLAALSIYFTSFAASFNGAFHCTAIIANQNNSAIQNVSAITTYSTSQNTPVITAGTIDTTQDQLLSLFHVTSNAPDSSTVYSIEAHILNTWGPI